MWFDNGETDRILHLRISIACLATARCQAAPPQEDRRRHFKTLTAFEDVILSSESIVLRTLKLLPNEESRPQLSAVDATDKICEAKVISFDRIKNMV